MANNLSRSSEQRYVFSKNSRIIIFGLNQSAALQFPHSSSTLGLFPYSYMYVDAVTSIAPLSTSARSRVQTPARAEM